MAEFTNKATLTVGGISIDSNVVSGTREGIEELTKTALLPTYGDGPVTFVVSFVNNGTTEVSNLSLSDDLGAYALGGQTLYPLEYVSDSVMIYLSGALQPVVTPKATQPFEVAGLNVPAGGNLLLIYAATPTAYAPRGEGQSVTNTVTATSPDLAAPIEASAEILPAQNADLSLSKSVDPQELVAGEPVTYTVVALNSGAEAVTATDALVISDTLDPALTGLTVTLDGVALEEGTGYTYDESTGAFATVAGAVTVPAATFAQDPATGVWSCSPGAATLRITGTV